MLFFSSIARRAASSALLLASAPGFWLGAQQAPKPGPPGPRIGVMTRHGLAGVVTAVSASQIVMEIPEDVSMTVNVGPSTRIVDLGQPGALQDIHVGDAIFASGQVDDQARTIDATVVELRPAQAARMLEIFRGNFGRTWTAGVVTAIEPGSITVKRMDGQSQTVGVDADTIYKLRDQPGDSSMLRLGERVNVMLRSSGRQLLARTIGISGLAR
jgi:Domain of unknown function (DUF5666)